MNYSRVFLMIVVGVLGIVFGCGNGNQTMDLPNEHSRQAERDWMVDTQIVGGGITDPRVVAAMRRVVPSINSSALKNKSFLDSAS